MTADLDGIDWAMLGRRYVQAEAALAAASQEDRPRPYSDEWYGELLRRTFEHRGTGFITEAEARRLREMHTGVDRLNRERAEQQVSELQAEIVRKNREAAGDVVKWIRANVNDRTIPSKYRREGALLVAAWLEEKLAATQAP